jgi:hypothetical protein
MTIIYIQYVLLIITLSWYSLVYLGPVVFIKWIINYNIIKLIKFVCIDITRTRRT